MTTASLRLPAPTAPLFGIGAGASWRAGAVVLALFGLLVAFGQVVQQAVHQGELRRRVTAQLAEATWRCKALPENRRRAPCLAQLHAIPRDSAGLQILVVGMAASTPGP